MASSISLPSFAAKTSNILNPDGTSIDQSFAPTNGGMFRNRIINGNFDIWQRGTSSAMTGGVAQYLADRWKTVLYAAEAATTYSRQAFTIGQTDVDGDPSYYSRQVITNGGLSGTGGILFWQNIENVKKLAGTTATVSFYAKADATKSLSIEITQNFGTGGSPSTAVNTFVQKVTLTSSWQKFTVSMSVPSVSGKTIGSDGEHTSYLGLNFWMSAGTDYSSRTGTLGIQTGTFDIAQVQLEKGSSATPFEVRPIGTELALCQRYCYVLNKSQANNCLVGLGVGISATAVSLYIPLPVEQRAVPTLAGTSVVGNWYIAANGTARIATSISQPANLSGINSVAVEVTATSASITTQNIYSVHQNTFTGTLMRFESEL